MRTWFSVANMLAVFCLVIIMGISAQNIRIYEQRYEEARLIAATEYATEAAFINSLSVSENTTTYEAIGVTLLTTDTIQVFSDMMAFAYNLSRSDANYTVIEDSIAVMCLAGNDGYYVTDVTECNPSEYQIKWSPKLPYSIELERELSSGNFTKDTLAVTLSGERWYVAAGEGHRFEYGDKYSDCGYIWENPAYKYDADGNYSKITLNRTFADSIVSSTLTNVITYRLQSSRFVLKPESYYAQSLYIPSESTYEGINKVKSPSLLVVVSNAEYAPYKGYCGTLQGFKVIWKPKVIGFTTNAGEKKYCYEGQLSYVSGGANGANIYSTIEEAARAGYAPDLYALMQPVISEY